MKKIKLPIKNIETLSALENSLTYAMSREYTLRNCFYFFTYLLK